MAHDRPLGFSFLYFTPRVTSAHLPWLERVAHHGYDGVELPVVEATDGELDELRRALDGAGLRATAVGFATPEANPVDPDPAVRAAAVEHLVRLAERARALGADVLAGPLHSAYGRFTEAPPTEVELGHCAEVLRAAAERVEPLGVTLAVEPLNRFECYLLNTAAGCARLVREVAHPRLVGVLDTHHAHLEEADLGRAIEGMGATLGHVQLSENHRGTPGTGQVDFERVLGSLDAIGYEGWVVVEAFSRQDPAFGSALRIWRALDGGPDEVLAAGAAVARRGRRAPQDPPTP